MNAKKFIQDVESWYLARGMSRKEFAEFSKVGYYHLSKLLKGAEDLKEKTAAKLSGATGIEYKTYWRGSTEESSGGSSVGYYEVPLRAASGSMGPGSLENSRRIKTYLAFREDWIYSKGAPDKMSVIPAHGRSMSPTIPDGCMVLIDESQTDIISGRVYFFALNDETFVKRFIFSNGALFVVSDSDGTRREIVESDRFECFGRVLWYGCEL